MFEKNVHGRNKLSSGWLTLASALLEALHLHKWQRLSTMTSSKTAPIACTLATADFKDRIAWIGELTRDALRRYERQGLVLDLRYAPEAASRVREIVRKEQECCAFLTFEMLEELDEVRLTITAPAEATEAADLLFEQFVASAPKKPVLGCGCGRLT